MKFRSAFSAPISAATSPPQPWPGRASISPWFVSPMQPRAFHWSICGFRARRESTALMSCGVWTRISGTTSTLRPCASASRGASAASSRSPTRLCGFCFGSSGGLFSGLRTMSSIRPAAPSSFSCGKTMFTVTGTQAATTRASKSRASRGSGRVIGMGILLAVSASRELARQERQRHVPDVDLADSGGEDQEALAPLERQADPDVVAGRAHLGVGVLVVERPEVLERPPDDAGGVGLRVAEDAVQQLDVHGAAVGDLEAAVEPEPPRPVLVVQLVPHQPGHGTAPDAVGRHELFDADPAARELAARRRPR